MCAGCPEIDHNSPEQMAKVMRALMGKVNELMNDVDMLKNNNAFFGKHPVLFIDDAQDISCFDLTTGIGKGRWLGWGVCNGTSYYNPETPAVTVTTANLVDSIVVGAAGTLGFGDTTKTLASGTGGDISLKGLLAVKKIFDVIPGV